MNLIRNLLRSREQILSSPEHFRAFAPDPEKNYWQLSDRGDNAAAVQHLTSGALSLVHVASGAIQPVPQLSPVTLLFVTPWDTYSATMIGALRKRVDSGVVSRFGIVFFETPLETIRETKQKSWYFGCAYTLPADDALVALIGRVPLEITTDPTGRLCSIKEGIGAHS